MGIGADCFTQEIKKYTHQSSGPRKARRGFVLLDFNPLVRFVAGQQKSFGPKLEK
jgi:hypothetical protein